MYRFYVSEEQIDGNIIRITGQDVNHIKNVLRLQTGDWLVACNGHGTDHIGRIRRISPEEVELLAEKVQESGTELDTKIVLFQGIPKRDKMEWIIQKNVELGVHEIVPVMMKRCVVKLSDEKKIQKKTEHWQAVAEAAAKQCDRGMIPAVHKPVTMAEAFDIARGLEYNMIPYELQEGMETSRAVVSTACAKSSVGIFIGPEGGLEPEEVAQATAMGAVPITLGKRILRTETAGMALLSVMMFMLQK